MKLSQIIAYLALGATATNAVPTEAAGDVTDVADVADVAGVSDAGLESEAGANLPGLNALQTKYAIAIIDAAKKAGVEPTAARPVSPQLWLRYALPIHR